MNGLELILKGIIEYIKEKDEKEERRHKELIEVLGKIGINQSEVKQDHKKTEEQPKKEVVLTEEEKDEPKEITKKTSKKAKEKQVQVNIFENALEEAIALKEQEQPEEEVVEKDEEKTEENIIEATKATEIMNDIKIPFDFPMPQNEIEEKPGEEPLTLIDKMKIEMVEVNKKIESGELVIEKDESLYDEPEDEVEDIVDVQLGADSNLKPFAIVPEEVKVAANEVIQEAMEKINEEPKESVEEPKEEKTPMETLKEKVLSQKGNMLGLEAITDEVYLAVVEGREKELPLSIIGGVLKIRNAMAMYEKQQSEKQESDIKAELENNKPLLEPVEIEKNIEGVTDIECSSEVKVIGVEDSIAKMIVDMVKNKTEIPFTTFNGEIKLLDTETKEVNGETLYRALYTKTKEVVQNGQVKGTIPENTKTAFVSKNAYLGKDVILYPNTFIMSGAVIEEGTLIAPRKGEGLIVKKNSLITKKIYTSQENLDSSSILNYSVQ